MSDKKWTPDQFNAINAQDGTLLVSAAAGSGKTAVLVERVIKKITDEKNPSSIDRLLIVTFTKAAAAEMKERINSAIIKIRKSRPFDLNLLRQQMLLTRAKICTIDSFCNDTIKENFHKLGISPDYKILDESELAVIEEDALTQTIEQMYEKNDDGFHGLVDLICKNNDDSQLIKVIKKIKDHTTAYPFESVWLDKIKDMYDENIPVQESLWGKIILEYVSSSIDFAVSHLKEAVEMMEEEFEIYDKYAQSFNLTISELEKVKAVCDDGKWDELIKELNEISFSRLLPLKGYNDHPVKISVVERRNKVKKLISDLTEVFCITQEEHFQDMVALKPIVNSLIECVCLYSKILLEIKMQKKALHFSDIQQLTIKLLIEKNGDEFVKTQQAIEISKKYDEILIDEYQDTNQAQNMIFNAISNDEKNMFFVGDVKQSIYSFRQAMPEIFLKRRDLLPFYEDANYPARINLDRNFRSRSGVVGAVNFVFDQLMSKEMGGLEYDENEKLVSGASYPDQNEPSYEMHILDMEDKDTFQNKDEFEAIHIANIINDMIEGHKQVTENGKLRDVKYSDICVMLRSSNKHAQTYVKVFSEYNIPAKAEMTGGFFQESEIKFILSYLRILQNPLQDVCFTAVMFSPVYGFSADDLTLIKSKNRKNSMYSALKTFAENEENKYEKIIKFLNDFEKLRTMSCLISCEELIREIYNITSYRALMLASSEPEKKVANLELILKYANTFEATGYKGLSGFVRFIDSMQRLETKVASASVVGNTLQAVKVMSIHHSKGLEFPVCILAGCGSVFNDSATKENVLLDPNCTIGLKRKEQSTLREFKTTAFEAIKIQIQKAQLSEELRVLYVAMTRARETLITVMSINKVQKKLATLVSNISDKNCFDPFTVSKAKGYYDWLLMCAIRHPDAGILRNLAGVERDISLDANYSMKIVLNHWNDDSVDKIITDKKSNLSSSVLDKLDYKYPYSHLKNISAKSSASKLKENSEHSWEFFASTVPSFMRENKLTPAQRGTALHKFMQFANYEDAKKNVFDEMKSVEEKGWLTPQELGAINVNKLKNFFYSSLADRIFKAEKVYREYKFTIFIDTQTVKDDLPENCKNEKVLVQGIADCVFIENGKAVVVDYKTDYVNEENELVEKYSTQINLYRKALKQMLGVEVSECLLYSFYLNKSIVVDE